MFSRLSFLLYKGGGREVLMERREITHVVLIGHLENDLSFRTQFSIPCFSLDEAKERREYYIQSNLSSDYYDVIIVKRL